MPGDPQLSTRQWSSSWVKATASPSPECVFLSSIHEASVSPALRFSDQGRRRRGETSFASKRGNSTLKDLRIPTLIPARVSDPVPGQRGAHGAGPGVSSLPGCALRGRDVGRVLPCFGCIVAALVGGVIVVALVRSIVALLVSVAPPHHHEHHSAHHQRAGK